MKTEVASTIGMLLGISAGTAMAILIESPAIILAIGVTSLVAHLFAESIVYRVLRFFFCRKHGITRERFEEIRANFERSRLQ